MKYENQDPNRPADIITDTGTQFWYNTNGYLHYWCERLKKTDEENVDLFTLCPDTIYIELINYLRK